MIINHNYKYIYIAVPKTASTTVHMAWGHTEHPEPPLYHMKLDECLSENPECSDYFKFCFVRNPYDRFISTWFNLTDPTAGHTWAAELKDYENIDNFCKNFVESKWSDWIHFRPQVDYCMVGGKNKMDFVGRQENFENDFSEACNLIGIGRPPTGRFRTTPHGGVDECLTSDTKEIIYNFYKKDFELFNYEK